MILTLIFLGMIAFGIVFIKIGDRQCYNDFWDYLGFFNILTGSICLTASIILLISNYVAVPSTIQENKLKYESLCKRCEIVKSGYEDISKSDLIDDIAEWNAYVYDTKYWTNNPLTSWFNPQKIADNLDYINLDESEE